MANIEQVLEAKFSRTLDKRISTSKLKRAATQTAERAVELNIQRTLKGYDLYGKRFPSLSRAYRKWKKKYAGSSRIKGKTEFAAKGVPNHIRLSGQSLNGLSFKEVKTTQKKTSKGYEIGFSFKIYQKDKDRRQIAKYLRKMKREYIGIAKGGKFKTTEEKILKDIFLTQIFPRAKLQSGRLIIK